MGNIYEAIAAITQEIEPIAKGRKNQQQGFMYRGVDEVMNELQPILAKHRVFIVPEVLEATREERTSKNGGNLIYSILKVKITFYAEDGSNVSAIMIGEGMDSADKASNKAMAVAFKYACVQVFCIPTDDAKDPDGDSPGESTRAKKPATPEPPKVKQAGTTSPQQKPQGAEKPSATRNQLFQTEAWKAKLDLVHDIDRIKKAVYGVVDPFDFPELKDAINKVDPETFKKILAAVKAAGNQKRIDAEVDAEAQKAASCNVGPDWRTDIF